ncbi:MAG: Holliday junction resolvase RuvX [Acidimicrobiales bacterium]
MRVLALDLGSKRIGVAVSDDTGTLASPLTTVHRGGELDAIVRLVAEEQVGAVVVGLPLNMDGSRGRAAQAAERDAAALAAVLRVPVELVDERLTTVAADRALIARGRRAPQRRKIVDQTAATILLQGWLDGRRERDGRGPAAGGSVAG